MLNRFAFALPYVAAFAAVTAASLQLEEWRAMPAPMRISIPQQQVDTSSRTPLGMVVNWARTVRANRPRPESLTWERLMANRDGSVVCIAFTEREDAKALVTRRVVFLSETSGVRAADWHANCNAGVAAVADARKWISAQ